MTVTLCGLAAGIITYASSLPDEHECADWLAFVMNYPAFLLLFSMSFSHPLGIVMVSVTVWSIIRFVIQGLVKMLLLGP